MPRMTSQMSIWRDAFGREYTDRNPQSLMEMEDLYIQNYGVTRTELNRQLLGEFDRSIHILEVGSNIGNQLLCLQEMGFYNLYGIELQSYAVKLSKVRTKGINLIEGSAFDIPYRDTYFDVVFTSGVLIHIHPDDIVEALKEIHRCTKRYIWGFEYYADEYTVVSYRDQGDLLWKADFAGLYLSHFADLHLVHQEKIRYLNSDNLDTMFLLQKK